LRVLSSRNRFVVADKTSGGSLPTFPAADSFLDFGGTFCFGLGGRLSEGFGSGLTIGLIFGFDSTLSLGFGNSMSLSVLDGDKNLRVPGV